MVRTTAAPVTDNLDRKQDFFISYNKADQRWAEWIAWQLDEAGYSVTIQAWHFRPGHNFPLEMDRALRMTERTIIVLSPNFLASRFTPSEWAAGFARDPTGEKRLLIPIRVAACHPEGLLNQIVHIDLADGCDETEARRRLLEGLQPPGKPEVAPPFPLVRNLRSKRRQGIRTPRKQPSFPGPLFSIGPLSIRISVLTSRSEFVARSNEPSIGPDTSDAACVVEIINASPMPVDVEGEVEIAHGMLCFLNSDGATKWYFRLPAIVGRKSSAQLRKPIGLSAPAQNGTEVVSCSSVRYRLTGFPNWSGLIVPSRGNAVVVQVITD